LKEQLESAAKRFNDTRRNEEIKYSDFVQVLQEELRRAEDRLDNMEREAKDLRSSDHEKNRRINELTLTIREQIGLIAELESVIK
jgi:DNA repair exonuclease SbcCD ATPase subunit